MATPSQPPFHDDKSPHCIPFILRQLHLHQSQHPDTPFFIGLNGVQGAGKTTLVTALASTLRNDEHLETLVFSIDDLYLNHEDQVALATSPEQKDNPLVQHRGEPGTHDMKLAREVFTALRDGEAVGIPQYDKSLYSGAGDRTSPSSWEVVNRPNQPPIRVIIFEGWSVGFRSLPPSSVASLQESLRSDSTSRLPGHRLQDLLFVNEKLEKYDVMTDMLNAFIHVDAEELMFVYDWRLEQEAALRNEKGSGMTDEQVRTFVDGYYPAYELYTDALRSGMFKGEGAKGKQLRLIVGRDRKVKSVVEI